MFYQDWVLALVSFFVFPLAIHPIVAIGRRIRRVAANTQAEIGQLTTLLSQTFQGARHVKAYGMEAYEERRAAGLFDRLFALVVRAGRTRSRASPMMETLGGAAIAIVILYGGHQVISGASTPGALFSFITALLLAYQPLKSLANLNASLQEGLAAAERVFEVLDIEPAIHDMPGARPLRHRWRRDPLRGGPLWLRPWGRGARWCVADRPGWSHGCARRPVGGRKIDDSQFDSAVLRCRRGKHRDRRAGCPVGDARLAAQRHRAGRAGSQPVRRHGTRQHRLRPVRRLARRDRGSGASRRRRRIHPGAAGGLRDACRRARRTPLGRPAPAHRNRAGDAEGRADLAARRGNFGSRQRIGTAGSGGFSGR